MRHDLGECGGFSGTDGREVRNRPEAALTSLHDPRQIAHLPPPRRGAAHLPRARGGAADRADARRLWRRQQQLEWVADALDGNEWRGGHDRRREHRVGDVLVDSHNRTVYLFKKDTGTKSTCYGACAAKWPPVRAT